MVKLKYIIAYLCILCCCVTSTVAQPNPFVNPNEDHPSCVMPTDITKALLKDVLVKKKKGNIQRMRVTNTYTIPMVFHIIHKNGEENISDEQILNAVDMLNEDFSATNPDIIDVRTPFSNIIGDARINFALAKQAPDGNCTDGINRYVSGYDSLYSYFWTDDGQYYIDRIKAAHYWDTDKYLNVYVVNQSYNSGLAFFPYQVEAMSNAEKWLDGIMIRHYNVGNIGTAASNNLPHTFAHEVGHFLDLMHIWGNWFYPGASALSWENDCMYNDALCPDFYCHSDDLVGDTPNTEYQFQGCVYETTTCGTSDNATNIMGYGCELMFTEGQVERMHAALNSSLADRDNLWSQSNLEYTLNCSGTPAAINCKKLYNSFIYDFSIVANNYAYVLHYLNEINNKIRYRVNSGSWTAFEPSSNYYYAVTEIVKCATYEFQISEQCDTIFSPWSDSQFFYTDANEIPNVLTSGPLDSLDCFLIDTIQSCNNLLLSINKSNQSYFETNDGMAEATVSGGVAPYTYSWSNNSADSIINNLAPGNYSVLVNDAQNCALQDSIEILRVNCDSISLTIDATNESYFNASDGTAFANIAGGAVPYTYNWSNGDSIASIYNLMEGSYQLLVTDARGCSISDSIIINGIDCNVSLTFESTNETYFELGDGTASANLINATLPLSYNWSNGDSIASISNLLPGEYNLILTDATGCATDTSFIIQPVDCDSFALETIIQDASNTQINDGSIMAVASGGISPYTYSWSTGDSLSSLENLAIGGYILTVTDGLGCLITENILIGGADCGFFKVSILSTNQTYFNINDGNATVGVSGGVAPFSFNWSNGYTTQTLSNLAPGDYMVYATDAAGCVAADTTSIEVVNCNAINIQLSYYNETYYQASDGMAEAIIAGGNAPFTYAWSNGNTASIINNLSAASYFVEVTDARGCTAMDSLTILPVDCSSLDMVINKTNETYFGINDGTALASLSGGIAPYTYNWSNEESTETISNLVPGIYQLQVTDSIGCVVVDSIRILPINCDLFGVDVIQENISCPSGADGSLFIGQVNYGFTPYDISWSNGVDDYFNGELEVGNYSLLLTDSVGCSFEGEYYISSGGDITIAENITAASSYQSNDGAIDITVSGGTAPYTFFWSNGALTEDIYNVLPGFYWLNITDSLACYSTFINIEVDVFEPCPLFINHLNQPFISPGIKQAVDYIISDGIVNTGDVVGYKAGKLISLEIGFEVQQAATFDAVISACD